MKYEVSMCLHRKEADKQLIESKSFDNAREAIEFFDSLDVAKEWAFHCIGADIATLLDYEVHVSAVIVANGTCRAYKHYDADNYLTGERW